MVLGSLCGLRSYSPTLSSYSLPSLPLELCTVIMFIKFAVSSETLCWHKRSLLLPLDKQKNVNEFDS